MLRQLREIAMPLAAVEAVLGAAADEAARLLDEHAAKIADVVGTIDDDDLRAAVATVRHSALVLSKRLRKGSGCLSLPSTLSAGRSPGCGHQRQPTGRPG
ncbi:hypothetical protein ACLQ2D_29190 [Streptomyces sp. DT199]|uniref:hypothetical protein n=1 Tax=Streptomyces sp. DT199 TaxID=3393421 RepID=UPI003CED26B2